MVFVIFLALVYAVFRIPWEKFRLKPDNCCGDGLCHRCTADALGPWEPTKGTWAAPSDRP